MGPLSPPLRLDGAHDSKSATEYSFKLSIYRIFIIPLIFLTIFFIILMYVAGTQFKVSYL